MANDISKIKTPDGVVHDLKDSRVPANAKFTDTNYYHTTGTWSNLTYTATANGGAGALAFTIPTGTTSTTVALGNHTHSYLFGPISQGVTATAGDSTLAFYPRVARSAAGLFPANDNANAIITFNRHTGNYYSQLGFGSNGNIYYRCFNGAAIDTTTAWRRLLTSSDTSTFLTTTSDLKEAYLTWGGKNFSASYGPIDAAMIGVLGANRFEMLKCGTINGVNQIDFLYSRDGGTSWTDYGYTATQKRRHFSLFTGGAGLTIGKRTASETKSINDRARVIIHTQNNVYTTLNKFAIYCGTNGSGNCWVSIDICYQEKDYTVESNWRNVVNKQTISGWSGWNIINTSSIITYGNQVASQNGHIRFTFGADTAGSTSYNGLSIYRIAAFGGVGWAVPSTPAGYSLPFYYEADGETGWYTNFGGDSIRLNGTAVSLNGHTHSYLPLSGGALTGDVTLANGKTIRPAAATNSCSLGTASYPWNHAHVKGITIYEAEEVGLPFEGDGFLKYDQDSRLYLDNTAYATAAHKHGMTSANDMIIGGSGGTPTRLAKGSNNTFLGINSSGNIAWGTPGGTNAGHTHTLKITTVQGTNVTDLQSNTTYKLVVGNASYQFKTPTDYTCLAEGTKILMADNSEKNIEDVVAGDIIMSYDPNTEKLCEAVIIDNIHTGRSDDYVNYYFDDGSFLSIFGKHCIYSADEGTARGVDYWEPGWKTIAADGKEVMYIGSENVHNAGRKRHFDLHSSNKLYFANGILNAQSLTLDYPMYKDDGLPEEYITALKADFDSSANLHTHQFDKKTGSVLAPILKELKAQKKVMDDNKKRLADSDYLVAKFTEGLISAAEWLKAKAERAGWRSAVNKAEPLYAAAEERYNAFKAKYKAPNTKRERFNAAVARDNACLDVLKAYYKSKNEVSK